MSSQQARSDRQRYVSQERNARSRQPYDGRASSRDRYQTAPRGRDAQQPRSSGRARASQRRDDPRYPGVQPQVVRQQREAFDFYRFIFYLKRVGIGAAIALVGILIFLALPITIHVNGQEVSTSRATTYQGLLEQGVLTEKSGNLLAVDGAVLKEGGGKSPTVYNDDKQVQLNERVSESGNITAQAGEDTTEPYQETQEVTPVETRILKDQEHPDGGFNFYNGILHLATSPGQEGITATRTGEMSGKTATVQVQEMKPRTIDNIDSTLPDDQKLVALTFDDGPNPNTNGTKEILEVLNKNDAKGTFFMIGAEAEEYPDLAREVAAAGHQAASHLYSHEGAKGLDQASPEVARQQVEQARIAIGAAVGYEPTLVRPTGGNVKVESVEAIGDLSDGYIGWNLDTFDYNLPGVDAITNTVVDGIFPGAVVLMHDGGGDRSQTAQALEKIIPKLKEKGYRFVTVDELIEARLASGNTTS